MAYYLPSNSEMDAERPAEQARGASAEADITDLKIFWGPEICRLEYLLHLMQTGRIVDEYNRAHA